MLQFLGSQRTGHDLVTEQQQEEFGILYYAVRDNHKSYLILNSVVTCPLQYFKAFITTLSLPVDMISVRVVKYIFQGNQQVSGEPGILTQIFLTSGFCIFIYFLLSMGKTFLCLEKFILNSKNLPKVLVHFVRLFLISLRSSEDGNFHNQPELSVINVFLNSTLLKLSSPRLSSDFLDMPTSACFREGRSQHYPG